MHKSYPDYKTVLRDANMGGSRGQLSLDRMSVYHIRGTVSVRLIIMQTDAAKTWAVRHTYMHRICYCGRGPHGQMQCICMS